MVPGWTPGWRHTIPRTGRGCRGEGGGGGRDSPLVEILNHFNSLTTDDANASSHL